MNKTVDVVSDPQLGVEIGLLVLHPEDNVGTALQKVPADTHVSFASGNLPCVGEIPTGHKAALRTIAADEPIRKYGQIIGFAGRRIEKGEHVHSHNVDYREFERNGQAGTALRKTEFLPENQRATFQGYRRANGSVGTRNYVGILTSVNCSATAAKLIASRIENSGVLDDYPNVDGVVALTHSSGCGTGGEGNYGFEVLRRTLHGYANHPNFASILVLGLGCEVNQIQGLTSGWSLSPDKSVSSMTIQAQGGTRATVAEGVRRIEELLPRINKATRTTIPAAELILAMECGGSDAFSGITANPALGSAADLLVRHGGTAVFGETTEIYGAEHLLTSRAESQRVANKLMERVRWWEQHVAIDGSSINNNPSPGNKAGGLTTILEKSLGAVAKGGTTNLVDVVEYAEPITARGLVYMDTPGYDPVNATGMVAGGAHVLAFTTGRGSAFGCKPTPSIKLATNTPLYERMSEDIDLNCGAIADGRFTIEEMGQQIFDLILRVASGEETKSEQLGYGDNEFVPWQLSTVL
ncbi:UxaA family hydrolase [Arthrobacter sp. W4I7]|uniref:UxaA family hydrolase n=1 Tax=Arthrobacter sp. W4I7 TaxID=3042296 RepID=UPI002789843F|nr:altronate dehydratase family protein [Arthrobacter sp. W4I7]MDQ0693306.1 altronate hydrolase [Arthrobacter sp. W4I7]